MNGKNFTILKASMFVFISSLSFNLLAQSPIINFATLETKVEENASIMLQAKELALHQNLPIAIRIPDVALIEAKGIESFQGHQVVYTVITDFRNPFSNGYTAFYADIENTFDLTDAEINHGTGFPVTAPYISDNTAVDPAVILVPESTGDRVMAFDRMTGAVINLDFVPTDPNNLSTPIEASPDPSFIGDIYLSDQLDDVVQRYDMAGAYQGVFAPDGATNTAILDNVRGIEFKPNGNLLVSVGGGANDDAIAEFDPAGNYIGNFVANGAGGLNSPFDVMYWETDNSYLVPGITSDALHRYDTDGNYVDDLLTGLPFSEQVTELPDGRVAVANFTAVNGVDVFILGTDGSIEISITSAEFGGLRGVYLLGDGNLMITNGGGVHKIDLAGNTVETIIAGVSARFIHEYGAVAVAGECGLDCPTSDIVVNLGAGECSAIVNYSVMDTGSCAGLVLTMTEGLESGSVFPIGSTTVTFELVDDTGAVIESCSFNVIVNERPHAPGSLACNDLVNVSLDASCESYINADMILEGNNYGCYDDYMVSIDGIGSSLAGVTISQTGTFVVTITDVETNNSCWGTIFVEDKVAPELVCIGCEADSVNFSLDASDLIWNRPFLNGTACALSGVGTATFYDVFEFTITEADTYSFLGEAPFDGIGVLYSGTFDPTDPCANLIAFDDIVGPGLNPLIEITLDMVPGEYTLVMTSFNNGETGDFSWSISSLGGGMVQSAQACQYTCGDVISLLNGTIPLPFPIVLDGCGASFTFTDVVTDDCDPTFTRTYVATDAAGNVGTCALVIELLVPDVEDIVVANYEGECGESSDPSNTGYPSFNGVEIQEGNPYCNVFFAYTDKPITDCGGGTKILRKWNVLNWCTQESVFLFQVINLADNEGPVLTCPADMEVSTDFWYCYSNVSVPAPTGEDACSTPFSLALSADAGNTVQFGGNYVINELPVGDHIATWTATDECDNVSTCTFMIAVVDNVPPVPNCDEHTIVSLTSDGPKGLTLVDAGVFNDNSYDNCTEVTFRARRMDSCIDYDWTTDGAGLDDIPNGLVNSRDRGTILRPKVPFSCCDVEAGPIMIELEVSDAYGNVNYCMIEAQVQDKIAPLVICAPDIEISCDFWFDDAVPTGLFVPIEDAGLEVFGTMINAYDFNDNEAARQSIIINDPGNPTKPQPYTWGIDGWADDNCEVDITVRTSIIDDCSGDDLPTGAPANAVKYIERTFRVQDGQGNVNTCRQKIYVIDYDRFDISDITWPRDIPSPGCSLDECPQGELSPENLSAMGMSDICVRPSFNDDNCSLIGVTYDDSRFDFVDGACYKILREWTIIDWCQYDQDLGTGIWKHTQVIKVIDGNGPEFLDCPDGPITLCAEDDNVNLLSSNQVFLGETDPDRTSCSVHVSASHTIEETCSDIVNYDVKVYPFNGTDFIFLQTLTQVTLGEDGTATLTASTETAASSIIRNNGLPYNSKWCLPNGEKEYHRVLWTVEDGCGNISTCEYLLRLEDCKKPSPVCINGLSTVVMPIGGSVTIWAKEYNVSSIDDCTPSKDLLFSFSGTSYEPSMEYNCDNVLAFGAELEEQIWVADMGTDDNCNGQIEWSERNVDFCTTTIVITDNEGICVGNGTLVGGDVTTSGLAETVENASVTLTSPTSVFPTVVTLDNGKYSFIVPLGNDYTIETERNDDHKNGVSTLDLVRIQKHLLGVEPFQSPYDFIAADANGSEGVSALDLVEIRKLILGIYTEFPNNESWRFVDAQYEFTDPASPWPFEETIGINNLSEEMMDNDFVAIKVGDVNNTVVANATQIVTRNLTETFNLFTDDRDVKVGEKVEIAFSSEQAKALYGYQFTMNAKGLDLVNVTGIATDMSAENIGQINDQITVSWHNAKGVSINAEDEMFTLEFVATENGRLSQMISINSDITEAEAYQGSTSSLTTSDLEIMNVNLVFRGNGDSEFALYQNEPNPFNARTIIGFDLPEAGDATLTVFDVTGRVITVIDGNYAQGFNRIELSGKDLAATGVLYYRLDAGAYTATKKMVIVK